MTRRATFTQAESARPASIPAATRKAITDWLKSGYAVTIRADGELFVAPAPQQSADPFDQIDMKSR